MSELSERIARELKQELDRFYREGRAEQFDTFDMRAIIDRHLAAQSQWRSIESAPKTGRTILLAYKNRLDKWRTVRGQWLTNDEISEWENGDEFCAGWYETPEEMDEPPNCFPINPSHWQPLPPPPSAAQAPQGEDTPQHADDRDVICAYHGQRLIEWMDDPNRAPAHIAFTAGNERQIAYRFECAAAPSDETLDAVRVQKEKPE